jgi:hypothetical protein
VGGESKWSRDRPRPECRLAWRYLDDERMVRLHETLEPYTVRHGRSTIEVDVALPANPAGEPEAGGHWLLPMVFLDKQPVAPDLEVRDASGALVAVPTKHENQELTLDALEHLHRKGGLFDLDVHPELRDIVGDIVCKRPLVAEVATLQMRERVPDPPAFLTQLLDRLQRQFILWVPVEGEPCSTHHFSIQRRWPRVDPPMIPNRAKEIETAIETALGTVDIAAVGPFGRRTLAGRVALERVLRMLGLAPISFTEYFEDAARADSYHACVKAPQDFKVREVRLARILVGGSDPAERHLEELWDEPNQTVQGHESEIAHVHCVRREDPTPLMLETLLGVRDGLTTLWALSVMMTTVLLRVFKHDIGPATARGHLEVASAILLLGPALAAAWAVRSDEGHLLRNVLSGTRQLLMGSALLSIASALALIGYMPFDLSQVHAIEWYAGVSFAIAVVVVISWSITRKAPWIVYRFLLYEPRRNFWLTAGLAALVAGVVVHGAIPGLVVGFVLLALGFGLAGISANRVGVAMGGGPRPFAPLAGLAATVAFLAAGSFLGYYEDAVPRDILRPIVCGLELLVAIWAVLRGLQQEKGLPGGRPWLKIGE